MWHFYPHTIIEVSFIKRITSTEFSNSFGSYIAQEWDEIYAGITCKVKIFGRPFSIPIYDGSLGDYTFIYTLFSDVTIENIKQKLLLFSTIKFDSSYNGSKLILSPAVSSLFLHEVIGHLLEADNHICYGVNIPLGSHIASSNLTISDSGLYAFSRGYRLYDSEGVSCSDVSLIKKGIFTNRLHSVETASYFEEQPTGNGIAISYKYPPICRQRSISVECGTEDFKSNTALYLDTPYGGKLDMKNGCFSIESLDAFLLKNGQPVSVINNFLYSDNIYKVLHKIIHVGKTISLKEYSIGCGKNGQSYLRVSSFAPEIVISI